MQPSWFPLIRPMNCIVAIAPVRGDSLLGYSHKPHVGRHDGVVRRVIIMRPFHATAGPALRSRLPPGGGRMYPTTTKIDQPEACPEPGVSEPAAQRIIHGTDRPSGFDPIP